MKERWFLLCEFIRDIRDLVYERRMQRLLINLDAERAKRRPETEPRIPHGRPSPLKKGRPQKVNR